MVKVIKGDLLKGEWDVLVHQANCVAVMGAGLALQLARNYPALKQVDIDEPKEMKFGSYSGINEDDKLLLNLYGQYYPGTAREGRGSIDSAAMRLRAFETALGAIVQDVENMTLDDEPIIIGMPYLIGCGLAGGDWDKYLPIIEQCDSMFPNINIVLYQLV